MVKDINSVAPSSILHICVAISQYQLHIMFISFKWFNFREHVLCNINSLNRDIYIDVYVDVAGVVIVLRFAFCKIYGRYTDLRTSYHWIKCCLTCFKPIRKPFDFLILTMDYSVDLSRRRDHGTCDCSMGRMIKFKDLSSRTCRLDLVLLLSFISMNVLFGNICNSLSFSLIVEVKVVNIFLFEKKMHTERY